MDDVKPSTPGHVASLISRLAQLYIEILKETDPEAAALVARRTAIRNDDANGRAARLRAYIEFWDSLDETQQLSLSANDAKIAQIARVARIIGTTDVVQAHNALGPTTAGSIDFVLARFRAAGVTAAQIQSFLDENAVAWFSLTGHPTNPTTVAYTKAQTKLAATLSNPAATPDDLRTALRAVRDTPIVGPRKTPLDEANETLNTLDVIYDAALAHKKLFEDSLEKHGYAAEDVTITQPLIRPCAWTLGDGDGNAAMTEQALEDGIALHRRRIAARYAASEKYETPANMAYLRACFGDGFGTIDLRHNADDIITTVTALFRAGDLVDADGFGSLHPTGQESIIAAALEDNDVLDHLRKIIPDTLSEPAARIVGRLRVIAKNPDMCDKFIIAESVHPAHALAALLLLKIAGPKTLPVDPVVLSESVADLGGLGVLVETMLENPSLRRHIAARGRLIVMIAKSDTTRRDGRGEAEYAQYEAAVDIYRAADVMKRKYPELSSVAVSIKNGGGNALQRGGGRVTETPALHGRAAADARVTDIGPSTLTIQGQQQLILFCPGKTALGTLEALAAQNLYTKAGIHGDLPPPPDGPDLNRQYARADAQLYAESAGRAFDALVRENPAIDELLANAPWLAMKAGNVSSRPAKRGEAPVGPGITPRAAKGDNPKALEGRAISGERLTAHACLPVFSVLGLPEAMEAVRASGHARLNPEKYGDPLHHLYRAHKIHRDAARATINAAVMADFDLAWPLLAGCPRPSRKKIAALAGQFAHTNIPHANPPAVTLAFMEEYFLKAERLTYEMISGQKPRGALRHGDALRKLWPDLAAQVAERDRGAEFARTIECHRTRAFDAAPDVPLSEIQFRITQALYTAANAVNAPVGILATRTRLEPVHDTGHSGRTRFMRPQSYSEDKVRALLKLPGCLGE